MRTPGFVLGALLATAHAKAQHCEPPVRTADAWLRATLRVEAAHYESDVDGWYEGVALGAIAHRGPFRARASLPYYRLVAPTGVENGFGDLDTKLEWAAFREEHWALGPGLSASFPTGDDEHRLGMGHVMLGASIWATWHAGSFFGSLEGGYARALGEHPPSHANHGAHAHHGAGAAPPPTEPIPSPMNREELTLAASGSYELSTWLAPRLGLHAGFPLSDENGATHVTGNAGVDFPLGSARTSLGVELDFVGTTRRKLLILRYELAP